MSWIPPPASWLKFNVDDAARGKPRPTSIGSMLKDDKGYVFCLFSLGMWVSKNLTTP